MGVFGNGVFGVKTASGHKYLFLSIVGVSVENERLYIRFF